MTNLNNEQARAVNHINGPCLVLAGPGSGKTFTLVERIKHMVEEVKISPRSILVITFSRKAAQEMENRFIKRTGHKNYPVYFGTFHSVFYNIVRNYYDTSELSVLTDKMKRNYLETAFRKAGVTDVSEEMLNKTMQAIGLHKIYINAMDKGGNNSQEDSVNSDSYLQRLFDSEEEIVSFHDVFRCYSFLCKRDNRIDFDDMLYMCRNIMKNDRSVILQYRNIYKYFLVDEFQDINDVQYEILMMLAGDERNIFAVGDDDQSIYGFRGSNPLFMKRFIEDNPTAVVIDMYKNYRCSESVINAAFSLISNNKSRIDKRQVAAKTDKATGGVYIKTLKNDMEEADYIIEMLNGIDFDNTNNSVAILYRTERCISLLEEKLRLNGYAYKKTGEAGSYYETEWIKDIITYLRLAAGDDSKELFFRIINRPDRGLSRDSDCSRLIQQIENLRIMSPYAAVIYILKGLKYEKYYFQIQEKKGISLDEAKNQLDDFINISRCYENTGCWLEQIDLCRTVDMEKAENNMKKGENKKKIFLMTAHASKGLEFDTVFIAGMQEGIFPHRRAITEEQIEEERRLLYVAMTRAKKYLYVLGRGEEKYGKRVSSFLLEIKNEMKYNYDVCVSEI